MGVEECSRLPKVGYRQPIEINPTEQCVDGLKEPVNEVSEPGVL